MVTLFPSGGFLLKMWRVNPILDPAACHDPPALVAQEVHPPCCEGSGPAASSCDCLVLELEESSSQLLHLQFNPRERSRFEDKSGSPVLLLLGLEETRLKCLEWRHFLGPDIFERVAYRLRLSTRNLYK